MYPEVKKRFMKTWCPLFLLVLFCHPGPGTVRAADGLAEVLSALPDDPARGVRLEGAMVFRDLRVERRWAELRRGMLMETAVGAAFYAPGVQEESFGFDILAELDGIIELASPSGGPVPGGFAVFSGPGGTGLQLLLKVEDGVLARLGKAFSSPDPPAWKGRVRGDTLEIEAGEEKLEGTVAEGGWLRLAPEGAIVPPAGGVTVEGPLAGWTEDFSGMAFLRGGGKATAAMAADAGPGPWGELLRTMRMAVVGWKFDGEKTAALRFIVDSPQLQSLAPLARAPELANSMLRIWDEDATGFLSLSIPPAALAALPVLLQRTLLREDIGLPLSFFQATGALEGRVGLVSFGSPGDLALGIRFRDEDMARTFISSIGEWLGEDGIRQRKPLLTVRADLEEFPGSTAPVLHLRAEENLEGLRLTTIGPTAVLVLQKSRLTRLFAHGEVLASGKREPYAEVAGPVTPMMREALDAPAMLVAYMTLGDTDTLSWYVRSLYWTAYSGVSLADEIAEAVAPVRGFLTRLPTLLTLGGILRDLTYDMALTADVQQNLLVVQITGSYL